MKRTILAIRGDTQTGDTGGLVNPETPIPEYEIDKSGQSIIVGYDYPHLRPIQKKLWEWHEKDRKAINELAGSDPIIFLEMGDMTQGVVFRDNLSETNMSNQVIESIWNTKTWLDMPNVNKIYLTKGTGVHVWGDGSTENLIARQLRSDYPKKQIKFTDHYLLNIDGYILDVAHHGASAGIRNWTRGNVLGLYAKSILMDDIALGKEPPRGLLRAHFHEFTWQPIGYQVADKIWRMDTWIIPPYCFINNYAIKVTKSPSRMGVGMLALEIVDGKLLDFYPFTHFIDLRVREVV